MVGGILFDVDGVLVSPWLFRSLLARDHGITPAMTASFFTGPFVECIEGGADLIEVLPPFLKSWGWVGSTSEFVETWLSIENAPNEAVLSIVAEIRRAGIPCFVASTQERRRAQYLSIEMRFDQMFDGLFFSCDIGAHKPSKKFFSAVAHRLGRSGEELLFFDDSLANVESARAAGWLAEQFTTVEQLRTDVSRYTGLPLDPR